MAAWLGSQSLFPTKPKPQDRALSPHVAPQVCTAPRRMRRGTEPRGAPGRCRAVAGAAARLSFAHRLAQGSSHPPVPAITTVSREHADSAPGGVGRGLGSCIPCSLQGAASLLVLDGGESRQGLRFPILRW